MHLHVELPGFFGGGKILFIAKLEMYDVNPSSIQQCLDSFVAKTN